MKKIAFIIPWGGVMPDYFQLWLESCKWNSSIDFLIFTDDDTKFEYPSNVISHPMSFREMQELFQRKYNFRIVLDTPYKFCDFRPAYGEIFSEYLEGYDFWGHCDVDLIWGNIRKFITDEVLSGYRRIFSRGHCSLYENTPEVNSWYRSLPAKGCQDWREVFQNPKFCCFDEWAGHCGGGVSQIMKLNGIDIFDEVCMADINVNKGWFQLNRIAENFGKETFFLFHRGTLCAISGIQAENVMYVHFQKRRVQMDKRIDKEHFFLVAPSLITSDLRKIKRSHLQEKAYEIHRILKRVENKIEMR